MIFTWLLRFVLIYWLISVVYRWISGGGKPNRPSRPATGENKPPEDVSGVPYSGDIEDADFEEID